jgi:hypothetical protein
MNPVIDRGYLFKTLADLIRINSINPTLAPRARPRSRITSRER